MLERIKNFYSLDNFRVEDPIFILPVILFSIFATFLSFLFASIVINVVALNPWNIFYVLFACGIFITFARVFSAWFR